MDLIQYKCPCCGAALNFSGAEQKLACKSCGNTYDVSVLKEVAKSENALLAEGRLRVMRLRPVPNALIVKMW